jgi:cytoskeleton protein RodZ
MSETQIQETQISAGEQLKHLREQKNLSVQDIASRLNLEARIIEAIENNNFEVLSAATYVRGYLRSYAKILDADPETIISSYNPAAAEPPEIIPEVKHANQTSSSDKPVKAFTYLISLTLVILVVAWWQSNFVVDTLNSVGSNDAEAESESAYGLSYPITVVEHPSSPFYRAIEATEEDSPVVDEPGAETPIDKDATADSDSEVEYPGIVTTDSEGPDAIVMRLSADSWIEIFDALENKVYLGLAREGQVLDLKGTAPFSVVLGFAVGVSVEINGEAFDTKPFTRGGIARFSLNK